MNPTLQDITRKAFYPRCRFADTNETIDAADPGHEIATSSEAGG